MYGNYLDDAAKIVAEKRAENLKFEHARLTADEKDQLLKEYHPDRIASQFVELKIGPNKGQKAPIELAEMLQAKPRLEPEKIDLGKVNYEADVLVIGGGGAGTSAAIMASEAGAKVLLVTKLRVGDANTMMAEGGIQAADKPNDSPAQHYLDAFGGGHFDGKPELVYTLVNKAPSVIKWLNDLGVEFDKEADGTMVTTHGGGTSRKRMHACKDYSGAEIMRTLRDETFNREDRITVVDFTAAIEIIKNDKGEAAGAVLMNIETGEIRIAKAKVVIIATGGAGRMHYQGFPTSNHYGATADGLVLAYRAGAKLLYQDSLQYHPTGAAYPTQILGKLVTEKVRSLGAKLINKDGEVYIHPLETRDVNASGIIREVKNGRGVKNEVQDAVWLDTPMIEMIHGEGTILKSIPAMYNMFIKYGIDIRKEPILVYPTLHYQNGGVEIDKTCHSGVPNLLVAGEASGGVHGTNRLMGNSLLDVVVFGREAGIEAGKMFKNIALTDNAKLSLKHVKDFEKERDAAGIKGDVMSPKLLPRYTHGNPEFAASAKDQFAQDERLVNGSVKA
ncbi:MAG: FAD-binding protein [Treponema sp.]|nr:FAD-binding protein [Treponema sp.]